MEKFSKASLSSTLRVLNQLYNNVSTQVQQSGKTQIVISLAACGLVATMLPLARTAKNPTEGKVVAISSALFAPPHKTVESDEVASQKPWKGNSI